MNIPARYCGATTTAGNECRRAVAPGLTRCNLHGGKSPQAIATAQRYLAFGRDLAAEYLYNLIEQAMQSRCETCGRSTADPAPIIRAATAVLDRAGISPAVTMKHVHSLYDADPEFAAMEWVPSERLETIQRWMDEARQAMERGEPVALDRERRLRLVTSTPVDPDVIDAEVVPTTDPDPGT